MVNTYWSKTVVFVTAWRDVEIVEELCAKKPWQNRRGFCHVFGCRWVASSLSPVVKSANRFATKLCETYAVEITCHKNPL
jgi:hypothetical protein